MVNFYLDSRKNGRGSCQIRQSVNICGARYMASTGLSVFPDSWDKETQCARSRRSSEPVNPKGQTAGRVNGDLAQIAAYWQRIEATAQDAPGAEHFRELWTRYTGKSLKGRGASTVSEFLTRYASSEGRAWSEGTRTKWDTFAGLLTEFGGFSTVADLADPEKVAAFADYMRTDRGQKDTTAEKYFSILCRVVRYGERLHKFEAGTADNLRNGERFDKFKQPVIYLDKEELSRFLTFDPSTVAGKIYEYGGRRHQLNPDTLALVRDIFCFCALTSLRVSDALALRWADIQGQVLTITTKKTTDLLTIPMNGKALAIIEGRNEGAQYMAAHVFEGVSVATINEYIKTLGYLCKINAPITRTYMKAGRRTSETRPKYELLSSHAARRTFVVMALSLGVAPAVVMKFTGHSNYNAMRPYIDITETAQADAMRLFDTL